MNVYQTLNNGASFFIFAAVLAGFYRLIGDTHVNLRFISENADSIFLAVFIIFFRIKMHLDDNKYFKEFNEDKSRYKYFGLLIAVSVWFFMALSAGTVRDMETSPVFLAVAFALSTAWIAVHLMEIALSSPSRAALKAIAALRHKWIIINMCYIVLLVLYALGANITLAVLSYQIDITKWGFILLMIMVMIADHIISDPSS